MPLAVLELFVRVTQPWDSCTAFQSPVTSTCEADTNEPVHACVLS